MAPPHNDLGPHGEKDGITENPTWLQDRIIAMEFSILNILDLSSELAREETNILVIRQNGDIPSLGMTRTTLIVIVIVVNLYLFPTLPAALKRTSPLKLPIAKEELVEWGKYFMQRKGNVPLEARGDAK